MRKFAVPLLLCPLLTFAVAAHAASQMKPGLWEMTMKSDAIKDMPKISPEQMEQMRKMGVTMPQMQDGAMVTKVCITKEMAESSQAPGVEKNEMGCETKNYQKSGNSYSADIVCNGADMKGNGKVKGTYSGDSAFSSTYDFKGAVHGQPVNQHHESSGKWLSADCGNVKPMAGMPQKK